MSDISSNINVMQTTSAAKATTRRDVLAAIKTASDKTGVDFTYLVNKAAQESSFNPNAKASGSSATGLYQFIDQTWLKTIKENGADYGLGEYADKITIGSDGKATVADASDRKAILELRKDPQISADMAAELAKDNKEALQKQVGGKIGATEMYLAHFLGSGGAAELLGELKTNPNAKAADLLPSAASANKSVFYNRATGEALSVSEIYSKFAAKFDKAPDLGSMDTQVASAAATRRKLESVSGGPKITRVADAVGTSLANEISLSSIDRSTASASGSMVLGNSVTLDKTAQSPFAAMVLAQMDMETFALDAKDGLSHVTSSDGERRKTVLDTLAQVSG